MDLSQLQSRTKVDPNSYREEFLLQYSHFQTQLQIFLLTPTKDFKIFTQLVNYITHVSHCYPDITADFPQMLVELLEKNSAIMEPELRKALAKSLILLRSKNSISPLSLFSLFFKLFSVHDKELRSLLYSHIIGDIQNMNKRHKDPQLNRALQNLMYTMLNDAHEIAAAKALAIMVELHKKGTWNDDKTVNVIASGCFSKHSKIVLEALKFFLTIHTDEDEEKLMKAKEKARTDQKRIKLRMKVTKKSRGAFKKLESKLVETKKVQSQENDTSPNWPAIELIYDPQGFAEKLFGMLKKSGERFEVRLMMMNLISRLIHTHKLLLLNFYPFLQKFLTAQQKHVTYVLAVLAQATHALVPPDALEAVVRTIVDNFVNDRSRVEAMIAGLNTVREMCARNPTIINQALLRDLAQYKKHKEKGVMSAARGIIAVYRAADPLLLAQKDRGRRSQTPSKLSYGDVKVHTGVEGIELLEQLEQMGNANDENMEFEDDEELEDFEEDENFEYDEELDDLEEELEDDGTGGTEGDEQEEEEPNQDANGEVEEVFINANGEVEYVNTAEDEESAEEENEEAASTAHITEESNKGGEIPTQKLDATRILTEQDYQRLNKLKALSENGKPLTISRQVKEDIDAQVSEEESEEDEENAAGFVNAEDIEHKKKEKLTAEQKRALAKEKVRAKFGHQERDKLHTNMEKNKNKSFMMTLSKAKQKKRKFSMRDRQIQKGKGLERHSRRRFL